MREWLASIVGDSLAPIMTVILAAALVVLLALVLIGLAKRIFAGSGGIGGRSRAPRLAVLDMAPVDPKRKLVLVRRDDVEHLILIGGQNDLVVEPGIVRGQARRPRQEPGFAEPEQRNPQPQQPLPHRRTPRPDVQPVPSDAQSPREHPAIAPVAEGRTSAIAENRVEPSPRAPAVMPERGFPNEGRAPNVAQGPSTASPDNRPAPASNPSAPASMPVTPVSAPPVSPAVRMAEDVAPARRADAAVPAEPNPVAPRYQEPAVEAPQVAAPQSRPTPPAAPMAPVSRRAEPVPPTPERVEPSLTLPEPTQPAAVAPPVMPPRPAALPVAQTMVPAAPTAQPAAPTASASAPSIPKPAAPPITPPAPSVAATPSSPAPIAPRSMATPTLPQLSRATPVAPQPRPEPEISPARSLWAPSPGIMVTPPLPNAAVDAPAPSERDASVGSAAPSQPLLPERVPVRWPPAPIAPRADETTKAEVGFAGPAADAGEPGPAPLSVKSFATTIQERRATVPVEPTVAPVPPVRPPHPPQPEVLPSPVSVPQREPETADAKPEDSERPLTLEEEMERLLHDFTIDVSERR